MDLEGIVNVCECVLGCCTSCEEVQDEALLAELEAMRLRLGQLFYLQIVLRVNLTELSRLHLATEIPDRLEQAFEELALAADLCEALRL